jgi:hypothetical protein
MKIIWRLKFFVIMMLFIGRCSALPTADKSAVSAINRLLRLVEGYWDRWRGLDYLVKGHHAILGYYAPAKVTRRSVA